MELPRIIMDVVDSFSKLPGVGDKTALRQTLILANWTQEDLDEFGTRIQKMQDLRKCPKCGLFADDNLCRICSSPKRSESKLICVVETVTDCLAIERSGQFNGRYHILGGVLNPLMGVGPSDLGIDKMVERLRDEEVTELLLAINPSVEGDATCSYIKQQLPDSIQVERIGFGIPIGGSLEYLDSMTISKALENKKMM